MNFIAEHLNEKSKIDTKFKSYKRIAWEFIFFVIIFFILDQLIGSALKYLGEYRQVDMHSLMWNDFYQQERNTIDVLFVGSSHARFAFNTSIFDKSLQIKSFNLSTSDQTPVIGYWALKEALKYQKPKLLVYEAYWRKFGTNDNTTPAYFVYDYVDGIDTKSEIMLSLIPDQNFREFFFQEVCQTYKYKNYGYASIQKIINGNVIFAKGNNARNNYLLDWGDYKYYQNGFFGSDKQATTDQLFVNNPFKTGTSFTWNKKQLNYFRKTIELCKKNDIKVLIVTVPLPSPSMSFVKNYESYRRTIADICQNNNIEFIDFNLINKKSHVFTNEDFMDSNHLNSSGAKKLDFRLVPILNKYLHQNIIPRHQSQRPCFMSKRGLYLRAKVTLCALKLPLGCLII